MNRHSYILSAFIICFISVSAQSLERQVINANGGTGVAGNMTIDYSIGEPVVETGSTAGKYFTQGFLQPDTVFIAPGVFAVSIFYSSESCVNANDGYIIANAINASGPVTWQWAPTGDTVSSLLSLSPGLYILTASDTAGNSIVDTVEIISSTAPCALEFFNAITPNADGKNDDFIIGNIETYPENALYVYNRYGSKVWEGQKYNNTSVLFSGKDSNGTELPAGTYFYVLTINEGEQKGWIEIIR